MENKFSEVAAVLHLPHWPPQPDLIFWIALTLVLAALLGEFAQRLQLPRLLGYGAMGMVMSALGHSLADGGLRGTDRLLVDLALAVLLFELGSRVSLHWLRVNKLLWVASLAESAASFGAIFVVLRSFDFDAEEALAGSCVLGAAAGALAGRMAAETGSAGQVTERMIVFSALNLLYAVLLFKLMGGGLSLGRAGDWGEGVAQPLYTFAGAVLLAALLARAVEWVLRRSGLREENSALLVLGLLLLALSLARALALSTLLVPLMAGVLLRNRSPRPCIWPRHFGTAGGVLVLLLFVLVGAAWSWKAMVLGGVAAAALLVTRFLAKAVVLVGLARVSGIEAKQGLALAFTLSPVSATALVLLADLQRTLPDLAQRIAPVVLASTGLMVLLGPILVLVGLRMAKEHT
ncbi:MAG TPA: cation:proton antiporter [Burkholderiaceae bacterium]|jgi:Kef-type K+ transport system membrane component KefB